MSDVNISFDIRGPDMRVIADKAVKKAVPVTAMQALKDCNKYCKFDYGGLIFSSVIHTQLASTVNTSEIPDREMQWARASEGSDIENGVLVWNMPYAEDQYDFPVAHQDKNPLATSEWCKWAEHNHGNNWKRVFVNTLNREGLG